MGGALLVLGTEHRFPGACGNVCGSFATCSATLQRLGMQLNLNSTPAQDPWTEAASSLSRIEMYYR